MDVTERDRLAAALIALRPDWASNGIDRLRTMRQWLTDNAMEWTYRDAALQLVAVALDPTSNGPARVLTDGPWRQLTRIDHADVRPPAYVKRGRICECGVREDVHDRSAAVLEPHPFTPERSTR